MPLKEFLEAGQIVGTHGVRGEVRLQPWCDSPAQLTPIHTLYWDEGKTPVKVTCRPHKQMALVKIDGVDTVQDAALLRGKILYLNRRDLRLPEGACFIRDLLGCRIVDADTGEEYGELTFVSATGANDVYHMRHRDGREILIPAIPAVVIDKDVENGRVLIRPMKGLLDDAD
ncbi:MAG: ribosome maturation factor RimM [Acutalibacteraceae bacterium]|jgi:16S rRNA processing protein RimM